MAYTNRLLIEDGITSVTAEIGGQKITCTIERSNRKSLMMRLSPDGKGIELKAPLRMPTEEIIGFVYKKESWLIKRFKALEGKDSSYKPREYINGEKHLLFGEIFTLEVINDTKKIKPKFKDNILTVHATTSSECEVAVKNWYVSIARIEMSKIFAPIASDFMQRYGKSYRMLEYKFVTSYWGLCTSGDVIRINLELMRADKECIEYVIAHELCHLIHKNHSSRFYALQTEFMPDWQRRKEKLNNMISYKH